MCISLLGKEGMALGRDFVVRLLNSGVKPSISGNLWSEGGIGLFGIYAHGISETWVMEKALIGLVACESERHTAINITKWTNEALEKMGLTAAEHLLSCCPRSLIVAPLESHSPQHSSCLISKDLAVSTQHARPPRPKFPKSLTPSDIVRTPPV